MKPSTFLLGFLLLISYEEFYFNNPFQYSLFGICIGASYGTEIRG
jgi:hypothetical protein